MKIKYIYLLIALMIVGLFTSCNEDDWLQRTPKDRITDEQLWNDPNMILGLLITITTDYLNWQVYLIQAQMLNLMMLCGRGMLIKTGETISIMAMIMHDIGITFIRHIIFLSKILMSIV